MIDGDPHQYVESFQATPFPSAGPLRTYTSGQLEFFEDDHDLCPEVDSAVYHLYDKSALAEVKCYRINKKKLKWEYEELWQVQHDIWKCELTIGGCAWRMAGARIYQRIEVVNRARLHILMDEYKARRCRRQSLEGGNVTIQSDFTLLRRYIGLLHFIFLPFFTPKPMYDTIWWSLLVRYDLVK